MSERIRKVQYDDLAEPVQVFRASDGRDISFQTRGKREGYPIFFFHGSPGSRIGPLPNPQFFYFNRLHVVSADRPGYGRSDVLNGRSIADTAYDMENLADALGIEHFGVMGRSGGVPHALGCAALLGDRIDSVVAAVGVSPPNNQQRLDGMVRSNEQIHSEVLVDEQKIRLELGKIALKTKDDPCSFLDNFLWDQLTDADKKILSHAPLRAAQVASYREAFAQHGAAGWVDDIVGVNKAWGFDLAAIKQPVTLLHGENDAFSSYNNTYWMAEAIRAGGNDNVEVHLRLNEAHFYGLGSLLNYMNWQASMSVKAPNSRQE